jgi:hypothetical protein
MSLAGGMLALCILIIVLWLSFSRKKDESCPATGDLPVTKSGHQVTRPCPQGYTGSQYFTCSSGSWGPPDPTRCTAAPVCQARGVFPPARDGQVMSAPCDTGTQGTQVATCVGGQFAIDRTGCFPDANAAAAPTATTPPVAREDGGGRGRCPADGTFPDTASSSTAFAPCPSGGGHLARQCGENAQWGLLDTSHCVDEVSQAPPPPMRVTLFGSLFAVPFGPGQGALGIVRLSQTTLGILALVGRGAPAVPPTAKLVKFELAGNRDAATIHNADGTDTTFSLDAGTRSLMIATPDAVAGNISFPSVSGDDVFGRVWWARQAAADIYMVLLKEEDRVHMVIWAFSNGEAHISPVFQLKARAAGKGWILAPLVGESGPETEAKIIGPDSMLLNVKGQSGTTFVAAT